MTMAMTPGRLKVLRALVVLSAGQETPPTVRQLAERVGRRQPSVMWTLRALKQGHWLTYRANEAHTLRPTEEGKDCAWSVWFWRDDGSRQGSLFVPALDDAATLTAGSIVRPMLEAGEPAREAGPRYQETGA